MRYLVHFRPSEEVSNLIQNQNGIYVPNTGFHSTIYSFQMNPVFEEQLIGKLSEIEAHPFKYSTLKFKKFGKNSVVLRLSKPQELLNLHRKVASVAKEYSEGENPNERYFGKNYNPHITISKTHLKFDRKCKTLIGLEDFVSEYHLVRKIPKERVLLNSFDLK
ncbi:MAG: hypothetical protein NUV46_00200 [Nanoarchaeota archaeon]|nr:hypothetical protein [Nanoarchaeota archaeon]